jgi:hypothetical protein
VRSIIHGAGGELLWVQPRNGLDFELRGGDEVVGSLRWERYSLARGETADQQWTFKREGIWHPHVTVRVAGSDVNLGLFHPDWRGGGTFELGRPLQFGASSFWRPRWDWMEGDQPLVHFKRRGMFKLESHVEIEKGAAASPDVPLLVVLGWYLLVLTALDAQSGAGA